MIIKKEFEKIFIDNNLKNYENLFIKEYISLPININKPNEYNNYINSLILPDKKYKRYINYYFFIYWKNR